MAIFVEIAEKCGGMIIVELKFMKFKTIETRAQAEDIGNAILLK